jgi:DnaK suppressor protein
MTCLGLKNARVEQKDLDSFKQLLTQWLDELLGKSANTVVGLIAAEDHLPDPLDQAVFDTERSYTLRIRDRESVLIKKIHASLEDIEDGVYGICDDCGRDISIKRLNARPVARRCIRCKTRQEERERTLGIS